MTNTDGGVGFMFKGFSKVANMAKTGVGKFGSKIKSVAKNEGSKLATQAKTAVTNEGSKLFTQVKTEGTKQFQKAKTAVTNEVDELVTQAKTEGTKQFQEAQTAVTNEGSKLVTQIEGVVNNQPQISEEDDIKHGTGPAYVDDYVSTINAIGGGTNYTMIIIAIVVMFIMVIIYLYMYTDILPAIDMFKCGGR